MFLAIEIPKFLLDIRNNAKILTLLKSMETQRNKLTIKLKYLYFLRRYSQNN